MRQAARRRAITASLLAMVAVSLALAPPAGSVPTSVTVSSGSLGVGSPTVNDFAVITLNGAAQAAEAPLEAFSVTDARGSGGGWALKVQASVFRQWNGSAYVEAGKTLPEGSLSLFGLSVAADGTDSAAPAVVGGPYTLDAGEVTVAVAGAAAGMGRFTFTPSGGLRVAVPANAYARTYRSELSFSVTSGP